MSKISRYRKSKPNDRRIVKKGTVTKTNRFSDRPSKEALKNNKITTIRKNKELKFKPLPELKCFEDWDLNKDGILNTFDVDLWMDNGFIAEAKILSSLIISKTLPRKCRGKESQQITSMRADSVKRKIQKNITKKQKKVQRTFKVLKNIKEKKAGESDA